MKKKCMRWITLAALFLILAVCPKAGLSAASVKIAVLSDNRSYIKVEPTEPLSSSYQYYDLKVTKGSKIVSQGQMTVKGIYLSGLSKNKVYDLYVRTVTEDPITNEVVYGEWTHVKKFCTMIPAFGTNSSRKVKGVWIKPPKIKGVTSYKVYMGYSKNRTWSEGIKFKKYCTVKPGKKKKITRYKGKAFKSKTGTYYFRIIPQNKKGKIASFSTLNKLADLRYFVYRY